MIFYKGIEKLVDKAYNSIYRLLVNNHYKLISNIKEEFNDGFKRNKNRSELTNSICR